MPDASPVACGRAPQRIIGHRGAAGYRPEQTIAAFELAARMGVGYLECDLVSTADGVLVAGHGATLSQTTDVTERPEFADRRTTRTIDGTRIDDDWFVEDFTIDEIKTLRVREPSPAIRRYSTLYDDRYEIATLREIIDITATLSATLGRHIGLYLETKHPSYFRQIGKPLEPALVETLDQYGLNAPGSGVYIQSFEVTNLLELREQLHLPLVQLTWVASAPYDRVSAGDPRSYADMMTPEGLAEIATYAEAIGPRKDSIIPRTGDDALGQPTSLVADAHDVGLAVHPYTFRAENAYLPREFRSSLRRTDLGDMESEIEVFLAAGVDRLFVDHPDIAADALGKRHASMPGGSGANGTFT
ncbi:glycerophosphodiester phosphodiesterase [Haloechinothrix sp. YIM 98757]|uniref:glycerophosphodiester phosphodiesterase n=1 Tax=Haloechinothrix aidingensis TaxID=2752311 RepID=A0A837ZX73_9PSEU|nr:glycerophosphodiester phosphodiesterase family protein [Haloechinothrix aidingensis]MBA0125226.1 glycerophosphodiester phosphodiesterase [Haloechinothrix aidingensis]